MAPPLDQDALLAHVHWLKALARSLVEDASCADDLVQETVVRALMHPPASGAAGSWLRRVLRNLVFRSRQEEERRRRRERLAARPIDSPPVASEVVEREETHRRLVEMLLQLEEPYRSALLLRFFDGMFPSEIAHQRGVDASTVRRWLRAGLDMLRRRLDSDHGNKRQAWKLMLMGVFGISSTQGAEAGRVVADSGSGMAGQEGVSSLPQLLPGVMTVKLKAAAALALIAAAILSYVVARPPGRSPDTDQAARVTRESSLRDRGASLPHGLDRVEVVLPAASVQQIHLRPGRVITGFVADAETAERIPDAVVRLGDRVVVTDAEGVYRIAGVADGEHCIVASAAGHAERNAVLRVNAEDARGDILLDPAIEVLVTVVDEDRKPIDGARIQGDGIKVGFLVDLTTTGADGTAALPGISRLRLPTLMADKRGYVFARREEFQVAPEDGTGALTIVLRAVGRTERAITGRITDPKDRPIPGVTIHWVPTFGLQEPRDATVTGANGRFTLRFEDEQETCKVGVHGEGWSPVVLLEARCGTPEEPAVLDFQLEPAHWLEGTVVDEEGRPVQGTTVLAMPCGETIGKGRAFPGVAKRAITANDGSFRLDGISGPLVAVEIRGEGWSPWSRERVEVDRRAAFTIKSTGSIRGRVVDAETGEPIPVFTVKLIGGGGYAVHRGDPGESFTSSDGGFVLGDLHRENPFDLKVEAQDRSPAVLRDVQARRKGGADEILVELYRLGGLEGVAFDAATIEPVRGARVALALWEGKDFFWESREQLERFRETTTGEDGTFRLEEGEPDWLLVHADGYSRLLVAPTERRRYADASGRLRIPLDRGHTLEGSYHTDGHGPASIGLIAEVAAPGREFAARVHFDSATTDASGKFQWEHLAAGTYLLEVVRAGPASPDTRTLLTRKVRVEGTPASLELGDDLGEHVFSGALVYPEGGRLRRAVLTLRPRFDWHYVEFVAEMEGADDQRFHFEGLRSGEYDVEVEGYDRVRKRSSRLPPLRLTGTLVRDLSIAPE